MRYSIAALLILIFAEIGLAQIQLPKIAISYNALTQYGRNNRDSVMIALNNLEIPVDTEIDRNQAGSDTIDYTPYSYLIWSSGDPTVGAIPGEPTGQAGLSAKEIGEVENFLDAGKPDCKKYLVIAGQNIAYEHGSVMPNGPMDTAFLQSYLRVKFVADSPVSGMFSDRIIGAQPQYWKFSDVLASASPDVVRPALSTPPVGPTVNGIAYWYSKHPFTPFDSAAGITFYNPSTNIIFYAFDWADPIETSPGGNADITSGVTRVMVGAFAFIASHEPAHCEESVNAMNLEPSFAIQSIVPNPARTQAAVSFTLRSPSRVTLRILDLLGRTVRTVFDGIAIEARAWTKTLDLTGIPSGTYTCELFAWGDSGDAYESTENIVIQ